jgi:toxin ParE1/3/4
VDGIVEKCARLDLFPNRGTPRFDLRPRLRTMPFRRRTTIAYLVDDEAQGVVIIGIFYGGQEFESMLRTED